MPPHQRDQRGQSLSALIAVVLVAFFLMTGLVVDGGRQVACAREAEAGAAQAARAAVDAGAVARAAGRPLDVGAVQAAGQQSLSERGLQGRVQIDGGDVRVSATGRVPTVFLSAIGIAHVSGSGSASAALRH